MTGGYMQYLFDDEGKTYLDTVNNVCHVGHCHPRVVEAAQRQFSLLNTNTRYLYDSLTDLAESLCSTLPEPLRVCYFVNSGSEANELALRIAKTCTGHRDFVVIDHAYHGNTNAVIEISPYKFDGPGGTGQPPHVHKVRMPDTYRGELRDDDPEAGLKYGRDIDQALRQIKQNGKGIAGFIAESISGVGGQIFLPAHYLEYIYKQVRKAGGLCIADEVQVGFGRVGSHFWAFELQDVVPDIVTMGKPMGNGHPIAAVVTTPEIDAAFNKGMEYFNTFGGNPVACTIGLSVLEVIRSENLQHQASETGNYFLQQLTDLMEHHPLIGDVRGKGLFIGIELVLDRSSLEPAREQAYYIANRMKENGILISIDGPLHNVIKIKPPLVFNKKDADRYVGQLDRILNETDIGLKRSR
jgi:4-aminobutyrate aminotransferase-like enzyme